jgi:hypothetical protein
MAVRNPSNSEKTIKGTLRMLPTDTWSIDSVSLYCNYDDLFVLPDGFILDPYRDYFENFLEEIEVKEEFFYSPSLFSQVYYGTPDLDWMVLYFAKMTSLFEFNQSKIKILPLTSLLDLNKLIVFEKDKVRNSKSNPTEYKSLDPIQIQVKGYIE